MTKFNPLVLVAAVGLLAATNVLADEGHGDEASRATAETAEMARGDMDMHAGGEMMTMPGMANLMMPMMNSARGRKLFASKGCVACHMINGVGGEDAPPLDAHTMQPMMNPFEFAAKMWRGAAAMIAVQEEAMGGQILFTGEELADIIAFVHDHDEQHKFSEADIPPEIMPMMSHMHGDVGSGAAANTEELGYEHAEGDDHHDE